MRLLLAARGAWTAGAYSSADSGRDSCESFVLDGSGNACSHPRCLFSPLIRNSN